MFLKSSLLSQYTNFILFHSTHLQDSAMRDILLCLLANHYQLFTGAFAASLQVLAYPTALPDIVHNTILPLNTTAPLPPLK